MICTVKKKFCSAGNRTELANYKLVMVNRIVVKHVVLFKHSWAMYKVIVHGVFSHYNIGVRNNVFEVNGLRISGTRINFFLWNSHEKSSCYDFLFSTIPDITMHRFKEYHLFYQYIPCI